ncbi:uncharacterized protein LOC144820123 [Lissotriton helveticus]
MNSEENILSSSMNTLKDEELGNKNVAFVGITFNTEPMAPAINIRNIVTKGDGDCTSCGPACHCHTDHFTPGSLPQIEVSTVSALCDTTSFPHEGDKGTTPLELECIKGLPSKTPNDPKSTAIKKLQPLKNGLRKPKAVVVIANQEEMKPCVPDSWSHCCCRCCGDAFWNSRLGRTFQLSRKLAFKVVQNGIYNNVVFVVILVSTITLTMDDKFAKNNETMQLALRYLDFFYTTCFVLDMLIKMLGLGLAQYFTDSWMLLEFGLTVVLDLWTIQRI